MFKAIQVDEFRTLLEHMEWADASIWKGALSLQDAQRDSRLLELFHHVHTVQWVYLQVWRGQALGVPKLATFADLSAMAAWARPYYADVRSFLEGLGRDELCREVAFPWADEVARRFGSAGPASLAETLLQVVLHSTHHRAQIATRLRELGHDPPVIDFISWIWRQRPEAPW